MTRNILGPLQKRPRRQRYLALSGREKGGRSSFLFDLWTAAVSAPATGCRRRTAQGWSSQLRPPLPRPCSRLSPTTRRRSRRRRTTPTTRSTDGTTSGGTPSRRAVSSGTSSGNGSLTRTAASRACSTPSQTSRASRSLVAGRPSQTACPAPGTASAATGSRRAAPTTTWPLCARRPRPSTSAR